MSGLGGMQRFALLRSGYLPREGQPHKAIRNTTRPPAHDEVLTLSSRMHEGCACGHARTHVCVRYSCARALAEVRQHFAVGVWLAEVRAKACRGCNASRNGPSQPEGNDGCADSALFACHPSSAEGRSLASGCTGLRALRFPSNKKKGITTTPAARCSLPWHDATRASGRAAHPQLRLLIVKYFGCSQIHAAVHTWFTSHVDTLLHAAHLAAKRWRFAAAAILPRR